MITPEEYEELDDAVGEMLEAFGRWHQKDSTERSTAYYDAVLDYYAVLDRLTEGK